ncbi:uncharacterized protein [Ptychodera flava]|uniref:uncharacterized protein n=1 Tax=Ptychodera flava TaxID=63121 RepID=UPI00396A5A9F
MLKEENRVANYDMAAVSQKLDEIVSRLDDLEDDTDRLESFSRRDNVRLYGVKEEEGENFERCKEKVVEILNQNVKIQLWESRHIVRAHRVPAIVKDKPRPIVVKFHHFEDKISALKARQQLKEADIGIGNDLTKRQRRNISHLKRQGKNAYYKNGKLVIIDKTGVENCGSSQEASVADRNSHRPRTRLQSRLNTRD